MRWLLRLLRPGRMERELDRELHYHIEAATADHMRSGMSRDEARRRALIDLGGLEQTKEDARDARGTRWVTDFIADTRYALRGIVRAPAFSAAAILTLAVGIGANTAVWSILDALMRRSLPVARAEELHALKRVGIDNDDYYISHPLMLRLRAALPAADSNRIAAMSGFGGLYATIDGRPEGILAQLVSGNFFSMLGVRAQRGRLFGWEDDRTLDAGQVAVLTDAGWERRFGRDPSVVGRTIPVNGVPFTIVGIAQPGFAGLTVGMSVDLFVPLTMQQPLRWVSNARASNADMEKPWVAQSGISWLTVLARAEPSEAGAIAARLGVPFHANNQEQLAAEDEQTRARGARERLTLESISRGFSPLRQEFGDPLRILMASVGLILLLACANLAGLLLARSAARTHEIAVRVSLGARPGRLVRQALTESVTLAAIGGALGLLVAHYTMQALLRLASSGTRAIPLAAALDLKIIAFAFALTIVAGMLLGLAPALRMARANLYDSFKTGGRVVGGTVSHRLPLGRVLVMSQIALSLILVASSVVLVRTFRNLMAIDAGFARETLVTARLDVRAAGYKHEQLPALHERLLAAARAIPGVQSASLSLYGLGTGSQRTSGFSVPGRDLPPGANRGQENFVTPDYFRTTGIPLLSGRAFTDRDSRDAPLVAVISQSAAKYFFDTDSAVGKRFGYGSEANLEVVGVVGDVRPNGLRTTPPRMVFRALAQAPLEFVSSVEVRIGGDARAVVTPLREALAAVDRTLPIREVAVMEDLLGRGLTREKMMARLSGAFAVLSLLLAGIGLYGVISYSVTRRRNEMGVRLALGASPSGLSWVVMRDSLRTVALGLMAGLVLWFPLLKLTERVVYGLSPHDPVTLTVAMALLLAVSVAAAMIPALRASRTNPIEAIRAD